jgi:hypothetical protein
MQANKQIQQVTNRRGEEMTKPTGTKPILKKDVIDILQQLVELVKTCREVLDCQINVDNIMESVPTRFWMEKRPTGEKSITVNLHIQ